MGKNMEFRDGDGDWGDEIRPRLSVMPTIQLQAYIIFLAT